MPLLGTHTIHVILFLYFFVLPHLEIFDRDAQTIIVAKRRWRTGSKAAETKEKRKQLEDIWINKEMGTRNRKALVIGKGLLPALANNYQSLKKLLS